MSTWFSQEPPCAGVSATCVCGCACVLPPRLCSRMGAFRWRSCCGGERMRKSAIEWGTRRMPWLSSQTAKRPLPSSLTPTLNCGPLLRARICARDLSPCESRYVALPVCVCPYTCARALAHVHTHARTLTHARTHMHAHTHARTHTCTHTHTYTQTRRRRRWRQEHFCNITYITYITYIVAF